MPSLSTFLFISILSIQWNLIKRKEKSEKNVKKKNPNLKKQKNYNPPPPTHTQNKDTLSPDLYLYWDANLIV